MPLNGDAGGPRSSAVEWVSFADPAEDRTWLFDATFLLSSWTCIYGCGCQGTLTEPTPELEQGCCSHGAHLREGDDLERVERAAEDLTPDQWQFHGKGRRLGATVRAGDGTHRTRVVDGACIFLNRPGFPGGAGCALHRAALEDGARPLDRKPDVCWQLPLRRDDSVSELGHVTTTISEWERRHWGPGGDEFAWWCTDAPEAYSGGEPVYRSMREEIVAMAGDGIYDQLAAYLDQRRSPAVQLPLPTRRRPGRRRAAGS